MRRRALLLAAFAGTLVSLAPRPAAADAAPAGVPATAATEPITPFDAAGPPARRDGLEALVPELAEHPYGMDPGTHAFLHHVSFSPGFGSLGTERLFTFRLAYNPNTWLGYEGSVDHNPGKSVHAVLHTLSAIVRRPLPGRFQPYLTAGYGMVMVFPGQSVNADPVTKNALSVGGGLEFYIRNDLALRADMRRATVFGRQHDREGIVAYDYLHQTVGLAFYRKVKP